MIVGLAMNAHVVLYYQFMCWMSEQLHRPLAQICYYTAAMKEVDPDWRPEHMR